MSGISNILVFVGIIFAITKFIPINLLLTAKAAGVNISIMEIINMKTSKVPLEKIINSAIKAKKAGFNITISQLQAHYAAGGNIDRVINSLIAAKREHVSLTFERSCMLDLEGKKVFSATKSRNITKIMNTPLIIATAKDRGEVKLKASFKVSISSKQAKEETIIKKVEEGILDIVARIDSREKVVNNLEFVSSIIMKKKVDEGTDYTIETIKLIVI